MEKQIVELLKDRDRSVRKAAVKAVAAAGESATGYLPQIAELFKDRDQSVRKAAARAARAIGEVAYEYYRVLGDWLREPE